MSASLLSLMFQALILLQEDAPQESQEKFQCADYSRQQSALSANIVRPYTVIVEGNVGAGKSTFVDILTSNDSRYCHVSYRNT